MTDNRSSNSKLYAARDHYALSPHFERHMLALTGERLESKSAIAAELAHRDAEIERLTRENAELREGGARLLTARTRVEERLRAALAGLKDLTCGECVPCNRINAEIDKALSGEPASVHETNGGWRPIETVPDPQITPVLGAVPIGDTGDHAVGEMHQTEVGWYWAGNDPSDSWGGQIYPAYWQPLPEPPGSAVNGNGDV